MTESDLKAFSSIPRHLVQFLRQLDVQKCRGKYDEHFSLQDFWIKLNSAVKEISQVSILIAETHRKSSVINVKELQELMNSIKAAADNLVLVFHLLPEELGRRFYLDMNSMTRGIIVALIDFIQSVVESKSEREILEFARRLQFRCEVQEMPKDNLDSLFKIFEREELHLMDVVQEIDEEVESNFSGLKYGEEIDNTEMWNNQDKELLPACITLVKIARNCLQKVITAVKSKGNCSTIENVHQLDEIASLVIDLTAYVDCFVGAINPPMNQREVKEAALNIVSTMQNLLTRVQSSHFIQEVDQIWLSALFKSVDYNNNKLQPLLFDEKFYEITTTDNLYEDD